MTDKQKFILDNPNETGENMTRWAYRLHDLNSNYTAEGYRDQIGRWKRSGFLEIDRADLILKKVTTYADGTETTVHGPQDEQVDTFGLSIDRVTTSPSGAQWVKYINDNQLNPQIIEEVIDRILDRRTFDEKIEIIPQDSNGSQLHAIISDDHIGLDTNYEGDSLFPYKYNKEVYENVIDRIFAKIMSERNQWGQFDELVINGLGDLEDGWDRKTTRGGHDLPQNMSNDEVFDLAVDSRLKLIKNVVENKVANKITLRLVTKSNHTSSFAIIVAKTIKKICDRIYSAELVEIDIIYKFIEHRIYGDHCFLLCHGKDDKNMKGGLPHTLNDKVINYLNSYIEFYELKQKAKFIHLWKGDSHRLGYTETKGFDYTSFRAICPPSNWAGTNFGDVQNAGYAVCVVPKNINEISMSHITLTYEKDL